MKTLAQRIGELSPAKRALFEQMLREQAAANSGAIVAREPGETAPLSFAQQRLWFLDRLEPGTPFYNVAAAVRISGRLDPDRMESALGQVIDRHEVLRTNFREAEPAPLQIVMPAGGFAMRRDDLSELPKAERAALAERLSAEEANRPFDLAHDRLFRARLLKLDEDDHVLLLVLHHTVCDGWSMAILRHEVAEFYDAAEMGRAPRLAPLAIQYADYALWQRERLGGELLEKQLDYWRGQFTELPPPLDFPTDHPRPTLQSHRAAGLRRWLDPGLGEQLNRLARDENATLFMVLLAGWQILLGRWAGQTDVCVGTPIANRTRPELESLIGFFANTLALRTDLSGQLSFAEILARVRVSTLGAYDHQDVPFEKLVDELHPERNLGRAPLFQAMFILQNIPLEARDAGGLRIEDVDLSQVRSSAYELTLNCSPTPQGLELLLIYNSDLFDPDTAERLLDGYTELLAAAAVSPAAPIARLPIMSPEERTELIDTWNATDSLKPGAVRFEETLFAGAAAQHPQAIAAECEGQQLTYAELGAKAARLAGYLRSLGAGRETTVGICLPRSLDLVVALVGVLKSGAAYVPLDPAYPTARLQFMLDDAALPLVVTHSDVIANLPSTDARLILVDRESHAIGVAVPYSVGPTEAGPDDLAYVIYTSGSTGQPKGVEVTHRPLSNHTHHTRKAYGLKPGDRLLQYLSFSFDASGEEFFPALASGATLVMHPSPFDMSGAELLVWSQRLDVNMLHIPPPVWHQVIEAIAEQGAAAAAHLDMVYSGGSAPSPDKLRLWIELVDGRVPFLFAYGVTEAAITSTLYRSHSEAPLAEGEAIPIGRPIANHRIYLLDAQGEPVPRGVPGEMYIGGIGLARGYRNAPEQTAARFLADPFRQEHQWGAQRAKPNQLAVPGAPRMYRTGDRARWRRDGQLEFLGRVDDQVKVRGYRIEPGEVETALMESDEVHEAVVMVREDRADQKRLVAYVVPAASKHPTVSQLRAHLRTRLPEHMIPTAFVLMESLPQSPTGKPDRQQLPAPDAVRPELAQEYVAPRNEREADLARVWAAVLSVDRVGVFDNFFELGGDSIQSIQLIARAKEAGLHFSPKDLFLNQTVSELALVASDAPQVAAPQGPVTGPVQLGPVQQTYFAAQPIERAHFAQAVLLDVAASLSFETVAAALALLIEHHDALRHRFEEVDGQWRQEGTLPAAAPHFARHSLVQLSPREQAARLAAIGTELQAGFDLASGSLLRAAWIDMAPGKHKLLLAAHHLVVDGVSWRILIEDLQAACVQLQQSQRVALPAKTTSYQLWTERLASFAQSSEIAATLGYWRSMAAGDASLPNAKPNADNRVASAATIARKLDAGLTRSLLTEAPQAYRTQGNDLLLAAFAESVCRWMGRRELFVELEGHGREEIAAQVDLTRTVGWFTTLFPQRLSLPASDAPSAIIPAIKEQLRAVPQQGLSHGLLRWLADDASARDVLARATTPSISFNYLGQLDAGRQAGALFAAASGATGQSESPRAKRRHAIDVIVRVQGGELLAEFVYSTSMFAADWIERLADDYIASLSRLVEHCLSPAAGGFTPSDFPLAQIDADDLAALAGLLGDDDTRDDLP